MVSLKDIRVGNWLLVVFAPEKNSGTEINYQPKAVMKSDLAALNTFLPDQQDFQGGDQQHTLAPGGVRSNSIV